MQFWNELEGRDIDGRYPLIRLVRSEGRSAWFESRTDDPQGTPVTVSLIEALTDADEVTERLQAAQSVQHPNLIGIHEVGQVTLDNTLCVYAVMDNIKQSLADVLQGQALSAEEAREIAESLVAALSAIHERGMSHGHVEAASVLATEQAVQLRSDCIQLGPDGQADDIAGIGVTLFHTFTQRKALTATDAQLNRIPAPFAEIVRNTFARRWTLAQVANALKPVAPVAPAVAVAAPVAAPPPPPSKAPEVAAVVQPATLKPPVVQPEPLQESLWEPLPPRTATPAPQPKRPAIAASAKKPFGLYAAAALVVLALLGWLIFRPSAAPAPAPAPQTATQAPAPAPQVAEPPKTLKPAKPSAATPAHVARPVRTAPVTAPTAAATAAATDTGRSIWRVIAYTYTYPKPAQEMVDKLQEKHPNLDVAVYSPGAGKGPYLVSLGGAMTHEEALKMLDKAQVMGLPDDTFVRNFTR